MFANRNRLQQQREHHINNTVAGRADHARISTTTDIYSHLLKSSDKTAAETLEQLFD